MSDTQCADIDCTRDASHRMTFQTLLSNLHMRLRTKRRKALNDPSSNLLPTCDDTLPELKKKLYNKKQKITENTRVLFV